MYTPSLNGTPFHAIWLDGALPSSNAARLRDCSFFQKSVISAIFLKGFGKYENNANRPIAFRWAYDKVIFLGMR